MIGMREAIDSLLPSLALQPSFFILGAGSSYGLVPTTPELRERIKKAYWSVGSFPVSPVEPTPLMRRVIGSFQGPPWDIAEAVLSSIRPWTLEALVQQALHLPTGSPIPPQYSVFGVVPSPAFIFNYNVDGLATTYCGSRHAVLTPHGTIDRTLLGHPDFKEFLQYLADLEVPIPFRSRPLLPQPEPHEITNSFFYRAAFDLLPRCHSVVLIGYSFGRFGQTHDDSESLEFFAELLARNPKPIFVIDPAPGAVVEALGSRAGNCRITPVRALWERLAGAIETCVRESGFRSIHGTSVRVERVMELYARFGGL